VTTNLWLVLGLITLIIVLNAGLRLSFAKYRLLIPALLLVTTQILIMQILFQHNGVVLLQFGLLKIYSGALTAAALGIARTSIITLAAVQFMSWTSSTDLALMLVSIGLPYRYAMLPVVASRFMPLMGKEFQSIRESQAVRGLPTQNGLQSLPSLFSTLVPLLYRAIRHASDIALSMELRGYGRSPQRTFEKTLAMRTWDIAGVFIILLSYVSLHIFIKI
jgi:energy-coupling factor transport system permease protein